MVSKRKFYRAVFQIEVLSEEPIGDPDLETIVYEITDGHWSGKTEKIAEKKCNGPQMARFLHLQGSDPEFFQLDIDGNDVE